MSNNRYDKYKDSGIEWIGEIPDSWCLQRLKTVGDYRNGLTYSPEDICEGNNGTLVLRSSNIKEGKISLDDNVYVSSNIPQRLKVKKGDILICSRNGSRDLIGKNALIPEDINASFGAFMMIFRCKNPKYFYYILNSHIFNYYLGSFFTSTINQLTGTNFGNMRIVYCPNIKEQEAIAGYLDRKCGAIDETIEKQKSVIEKLKEYKQSIITQAVTKGLDKSAPMKDSGIEWIGQIPQHWDSIKLKYKFRIKKDIAGEEGFDILSVTQQGLRIKDISTNEGQLAMDYSKYQIVKPSDFVMNHMDLLTGWVDCSAYFGVTSPDYRVFVNTDQKNCNNQYYNYVFQICYKNKIFYGLGQGVSGLGRWRLQSDKFLNFRIPIPPYNEQEQIVQYINKKCSEIDKTIEDKEKLIEKLLEYKKSLIYECVTGKRKVVA